MEHNYIPIGHYEYYHKRRLLSSLLRQFFDVLHNGEKVEDADIAAIMFSEGGGIMQHLAALMRGVIIDQLAAESRRRVREVQNLKKEYSKDELERLLLAKDEVWLADRRYFISG